MKKLHRFIIIALTMGATTATGPAAADLSAELSVQHRWFPEDPFLSDEPQAASLVEDQGHHQTSVAIEVEYYREWAGGDHSLIFVPFGRLDSDDRSRTHADVRELIWLNLREDWGVSWELRAGAGKVFWGVAESNHLVDVINQTDLVENIDGTHKLGQPMIRATFSEGWGDLDLFVLPYFRERTFPGEGGRLRSPLPAEDGDTVYDSSLEEWHPDFSLRYSTSLGAWDMGLSYFYGTNREPRFIFNDEQIINPFAEPFFVFYDLMHQVGLDVNVLFGNWIGKVEAIYRYTDFEEFYAVVVGPEYTWSNVFKTGSDINFFLEYSYDDRGENSTAIYQNDVFVGALLNVNDVQTTQAKIGYLHDIDDNSKVIRFQASRRLFNSWSVNLEAHYFADVEEETIFFPVQDDDYIQAELIYYL